MKLLFTLAVIFSFATKIPAQKISDEVRAALGFDMIAASQKDVRIKTGCTTYTENKYVRPLLVIDGIPDESAELQKLDAGNIVSIDVLKKDKFWQLGCSSPDRDIFLIITKSASNRKFIIKDFLTGENIPAATICFTSGSDTIEAVADDNGILSTDKLKGGVKYNMTISSAGYKTLRTIVAGNEQEVLLEKDVKACAEVVVIAYPTIRCGCCHSSICSKISKQELRNINTDKKSLPARVYPNPVQRNNSVYFEFSNDRDETMQLNVFNLNSSLVLLQPEKIIKGFNRISISADARWAAGIYIMQLKDKRGNILKYEKLVVQ